MVTQKQIIASLIQGEDGHSWARSQKGWDLHNKHPKPVCHWHGIYCHDGKTVSGIHIDDQYFTGTLPSELGQLTTLRTIVISQNKFRGTIPNEIAKLPLLFNLDLSSNELTGSIPKFTSPHLQKIVLGSNKLSGSLPSDFGFGLTNVSTLELTENALTGELPESLGLMTNLNKLSLSDNQFHGTLPESIGLMKLEYLYLDSNKFLGTIPKTLTSPDASLKEVWFQGNLFSGTVPAEFAQMPNLVDLYVDGNKLTGEIPKELCTPEINADFFEDVNNGNTEQRDYCASIACPVGSVSIEGVWPCRECEEGSYGPYLGQEVECFQRDQVNAVQALWKSTNGPQWTAENNWYQTDIATCDFTGITCDGDQKITSIKLPNFGLNGTIPAELGFLEKLQTLDLSDNKLQGYLPSDLRFAPLEAMDVSGNQLVGLVPPMMCQTGVVDGFGVINSCDQILCPRGTFSSTGRATKRESCKSCGDGIEYLGRTTCNGVSAKASTGMSTGGKVAVSVFVMSLMGIFVVLGFMFAKRRREVIVARHLEHISDFNVHDHLDMEGRMSHNMPPPHDPLFMGTFPDSVEVEQMHDDDMSSITRVKRKKGKKRKSRRSSSAKLNRPIVEGDQDSESVSSNPVWLDVPKLETPRSVSPPTIT